MITRTALISTMVFFLSLFIAAASYAQAPTSADTVGIPSDLDDKLFEVVEVPAKVDAKAWRKHLESNLVMYIENAAKRGMKAGKYIVNVRFLVERNGKISGVVALNDPGFGLATAAVEVVKSGPDWKPGEQRGKKVRSYYTQPIYFIISDSKN